MPKNESIVLVLTSKVKFLFSVLPIPTLRRYPLYLRGDMFPLTTKEAAHSELIVKYL